MAAKKKKPYEIGELDQYLFGQGNHYEIYKKLGSHCVKNGKQEGVYFAVQMCIRDRLTEEDEMEEEIFGGAEDDFVGGEETELPEIDEEYLQAEFENEAAYDDVEYAEEDDFDEEEYEEIEAEEDFEEADFDEEDFEEDDFLSLIHILMKQ